MKNRILKFAKWSLCLFTVGMILTSCSDFLEEKDKDQVIPRTVEQFEAMLHQTGFLKVTWNHTSDIMTDDIEENPQATTRQKNAFKSIYTWQRNVEYDGQGDKTQATNGFWKALYNNVLVANYTIENAKDAQGSEAERTFLIAEAYFLRARAYFELVNLYAPAYEAASASTTMGVPLRLGTGVENTYTRASLHDVYAQIVKDLKEAERLFASTSVTKSLWHPNLKATRLLLSRVYLYSEDWDATIAEATALINACPYGLWNLTANPAQPLVTKNNPEVLHTFGDCASLIIESDESGMWHDDIPIIYKGTDGSYSSTVAYGVSNELLNSFWLGDCRKSLYVVSTGKGKDVFAKWHSQYTRMGAASYRLSEAYLNRAEAYAAKGLTTEALNDVRELLKNRVEDVNRVTFPTDPLKVRQFVLDERRREFCGESQRWYDLKRSSAWYPKQIQHRFTLRSTGSAGGAGVEQGFELYLLAAKDPNFVYELPEEETQINSSIEPYGQRLDKQPINN